MKNGFSLHAGSYAFIRLCIRPQPSPAPLTCEVGVAAMRRLVRAKAKLTASIRMYGRRGAIVNASTAKAAAPHLAARRTLRRQI